MKLRLTILIFLYLACTITSYSQVLMPLADGAVVYSRDFEIKGDKDKLFLKSKDWIASSYNNYKAVIQLEEKDLGRLRLNGVTAPVSKYDGRAKYSVDISCIDNSCCFVVHNIELYSQELKGDLVPYGIYYNGYLTYYKEVKALKDQLKTETKKKIIKSKEKQIFDTEGKVLFMQSHISQHNKEFNDLLSSYAAFMK